MHKGFWGKLKKPILALAPMADVTDAAFRAIIAKYGKPDIMFTEFTSADGLCSAGKEKLLVNLSYSEAERPIVAQLFSARPDKMFEAAQLVHSLGFDGLDINMGCPDRGVCKQGAGGALIKKPELAVEIIRAAQEGAGNLPVSVKTRIGYSRDELAAWLPALLETEPAAITIHARTVKELSKVPARWSHVAEAVRIRDSFKSKTYILGNGDLLDLDDAKKKVHETNADGAMLGRAIFGNPWLFSGRTPLIPEKLKVLEEHIDLFGNYFRGKKNFGLMKKHFKAYISGFDGAKELRNELMKCEDSKQVKRRIEVWISASK